MVPSPLVEHLVIFVDFIDNTGFSASRTLTDIALPYSPALPYMKLLFYIENYVSPRYSIPPSPPVLYLFAVEFYMVTLFNIIYDVFKYIAPPSSASEFYISTSWKYTKQFTPNIAPPTYPQTFVNVVLYIYKDFIDFMFRQPPLPYAKQFMNFEFIIDIVKSDDFGMQVSSLNLEKPSDISVQISGFSIMINDLLFLIFY